MHEHKHRANDPMHKNKYIVILSIYTCMIKYLRTPMLMNLHQPFCYHAQQKRLTKNAMTMTSVYV